MNRQSSIHLHIEELVLHGFAPGDRHRIGEALKCELARLLADQGLPAAIRQPAEIEYLRHSVSNLTVKATAEEMGTKTAQAVYGGLGR